MATTYKVLGQKESSGTITTYDELYQVQGDVDAVIISNIIACNRSSSDQIVRISCSATSTPAAKEFIVYDTTIPANDSLPLVMGVTLDTTVKYLMCSSNSASVSFSAFGAEIS